jgi:hypothetical protein
MKGGGEVAGDATKGGGEAIGVGGGEAVSGGGLTLHRAQPEQRPQVHDAGLATLLAELHHDAHELMVVGGEAAEGAEAVGGGEAEAEGGGLLLQRAHPAHRPQVHEAGLATLFGVVHHDAHSPVEVGGEADGGGAVVFVQREHPEQRAHVHDSGFATLLVSLHQDAHWPLDAGGGEDKDGGDAVGGE